MALYFLLILFSCLTLQQMTLQHVDNRVNIVKFLIVMGADIYIPDIDGVGI